MNYWEGIMDWELDKDWICETCGESVGLTWGLVHAVCRCNQCHAEYSMRDNTKDDRPVVTKPISRLKDEYKEPLKRAWAELKIPQDRMTDEQLKPYMEAEKEQKNG